MSDSLARLRTLFQKALPAIIIGGGLVFLATRMQHGAIPSGQPAPPLQVELRGGEVFDLAQARGDVVMLDFWAAWCPACRSAAPTVTKLHEEFRGQGVQVIGVAMDARSMPSAERLGFRFPSGLARRGDLEAWQVELLPTTVIIGRDGTILESFTGDVGERRLRSAIEDALDG